MYVCVLTLAGMRKVGVSIFMIEYCVCMAIQRRYSFSWSCVFPAAGESDSVTRYCVLIDLSESC